MEWILQPVRRDRQTALTAARVKGGASGWRGASRPWTGCGYSSPSASGGATPVFDSVFSSGSGFPGLGVGLCPKTVHPRLKIG